MHGKTVRLTPGYRLQVADFMTEVALADDFTLGDLCQMVQDCDDMDLETLATLLQCPVELFIAECLGPCPADDRSDLHYIRLFWSCEYDPLTETRWPPATSLWLHVDGIGDTWKDCKLGGPLYEEGKDYAHCNRYAIEMIPLYQLRHLPLRIDPLMTVHPHLTANPSDVVLQIPAPGVTLLQLLYHLFWESSFFGTPENRDAERAELQALVRRIDAGEEQLIPFEDIRKRLETR